MNKDQQISSIKIKQVFLLAIILILAALICFNLSLFIPSVLGAITIYVLCRKYNFLSSGTEEMETLACFFNPHGCQSDRSYSSYLFYRGSFN